MCYALAMRRPFTFVLAISLFLAGVSPAKADLMPEAILGFESQEISVDSEILGISSGELGIEGKLVSEAPWHSVRVGEHSENSLQLLITLDGPAAPESFTFDLAGAESMEIIELGNRDLFKVVSEDGSTLAWLAEPWAFDALGNSVKTSFSFSEGQLTQTIEHKAINIAYPITADPYLGLALISNVSISPLQGSYKYSISVTPWLGSIYGMSTVLPWSYSQAFYIVSVEGWNEVLVKVGAKYGFTLRDYLLSRPTYKNQWNCHALGAPVIFVSSLVGIDTKPTWDLEGHRAATTNLQTWIIEKCNW